MVTQVRNGCLRQSLCIAGDLGKTSESEFAGIRVRQQRDFSITADLEDYNNKIHH